MCISGQAYGASVSAWSADVVAELGSVVVSALTVDEIKTLQLGTAEALAAVGRYNYYTNEQVSSNAIILYNSIKVMCSCVQKLIRACLIVDLAVKTCTVSACWV